MILIAVETEWEQEIWTVVSTCLEIAAVHAETAAEYFTEACQGRSEYEFDHHRYHTCDGYSSRNHYGCQWEGTVCMTAYIDKLGELA